MVGDWHRTFTFIFYFSLFYRAQLRAFYCERYALVTLIRSASLFIMLLFFTVFVLRLAAQLLCNSFPTKSPPFPINSLFFNMAHPYHTAPVWCKSVPVGAAAGELVFEQIGSGQQTSKPLSLSAVNRNE